MSVELTPSKRPYEGHDAEENGNGKCPKPEVLSSKDSPLKVFLAGNVIRVLFPVSKMDSLIGDDGNTSSQIRQDCGVNVQVEEFVPGCDETVITISGSDKDVEMGSEQAKADGNESDKSAKGDNNEENKQPVLIENSRAENNDSSMCKAVLLLFEKMVGGQEMNGGEESENKSPSHVMRLIVHSSQVSSLLGKNGSVIKQMSSDSGAEIKILPRDKLPRCASSTDDLVQISGKLDVVRKALQSVCKPLLQCSFNQDTPSDVKPSRDFSHPSSRQDKLSQSDHSSHRQVAPYSAGYRDSESTFPARINPPDTLSFRLLCPGERVGGLVGKGGTIINALQHETGCDIKILEGVADSDDRVIVISGPAHPEYRSAILDGVLRVHARISRVGLERNERSVTAKLLVSSNQIGCLLGKGGVIISDLRKSSGAYIRILGKEHISKNAAENDEVVQINGETETVHEALLQIIVRLLDRFYRDVFPSNHVFPDKWTPFSPFGVRRREFAPPSMYHNAGPPLGGFRPHGAGHPLDGSPFHAPGIPERIPSSAPWGPQGMIDGGGPVGFPDHPGAPARREGFSGGNHPAIITNTTMEVVVPHSVVPALYGEDGGCLRQICEISDARITITDTKPGATETLVIISGTPEQTNAAQSLIQAFVISETEAP
ncbi:hypothetical protein Leryth_015629 [Lithospermum erythrorhizon]|nr:hypothetical protein Leryth_015629 [Lithospermum erythrorhizon]